MQLMKFYIMTLSTALIKCVLWEIILCVLKKRKIYYPVPIKHIQLNPFVIYGLDCPPLCLCKLSFHNAKEIWNWTTPCKIRNIYNKYFNTKYSYKQMNCLMLLFQEITVIVQHSLGKNISELSLFENLKTKQDCKCSCSQYKEM